MSAPIFQNVQNANKCPHGFPVGACPICNSVGGVSRDKNKPRVKGEMSYNECMAVWLKMQAQKEAKLQAQKDRLEKMHQSILENRVLLSFEKIKKNIVEFNQKINQLPLFIKIPVKIVFSIVLAPINLILNTFYATKNIQQFFQNITKFIASISEKMAMVLGEIKNFIDSFVIKKSKKILKTLLNLFLENNENNDEQQENKTFTEKKLKNILRKIQMLLEKNSKEDE